MNVLIVQVMRVTSAIVDYCTECAHVSVCVKHHLYRPGPSLVAGTGCGTDLCTPCRWNRNRNSLKHSRSRSAIKETQELTP